MMLTGMADALADHVDVGTIIAGTYEVTRRLGQGGAGAVWAARHQRLPGRQVAIKVVLARADPGPEAYARFRHEAEIASRLGHPNIVEVLDFNELPNGTPYMVLELLKGESLCDRLQRGPLPLDAALAVARQIGSALSAAHKQHIVHRDLKPANIFLCPDDTEGVRRERVKVLDFGISKILGSDTVHTQANVLIGTPRYMSPEQALGRNDLVDQRTDEFALAAIVYEMLSGRPAFPGEALTGILMHVVHDAPAPLRDLVPGLPPSVTASIERALEKDPDERFTDIASFVSALTGNSLEAFEPASRVVPLSRKLETTLGPAGRVGADVVGTAIRGQGRVPAAILFGDMKGSTEEAEHDERSTVEKLREYERLVGDTARGFGPGFYKVKTEGDGFMATFATAHAMVECGFAVQQEFRRRGWRVRLGGHYGEVYRNESGDVVGADVNRAARIQSAANASRGQFLVSDAVKAIVRDRLQEVRFEPRAPIVAKGVPEALDVFEVVPVAGQPGAVLRELDFEGVRRRSDKNRWALGTVALATLIAVAVLLYFKISSPLPAKATNAIAVMEFDNQRSDENDWFSGVLQAALNTKLNKIPALSVIPPEIIKHDARRADRDEVAVARQLGARWLVKGRFWVVSDTVNISVWVTDLGEGVQKAAEEVQGNKGDFPVLVDKLALATVERVRGNLEQVAINEGSRFPTPPESAAKTTQASLEKYRKFLAAEGVTGTAGAAEAPRSEPHARSDGAGVALPPRMGFFSFASAAYAQDAAINTEVAARQLLEEYRRAHEEGNLDRLAQLYVSFPESQRKALSDYLKDVTKLHVDLLDVKIQPRDHDIAVSYTRRDNFVDKETGEPVSLEVRVTKFLVQEQGKWKFAAEG